MEYTLIKDLERGDKVIKKGQKINLSSNGVKEFIELGLIENPKPKKENKVKKDIKQNNKDEK